MVQLKYTKTDDFILFCKPLGLNSHAVDVNKEGLVEFLSQKLSQRLHLVSRLDQSTSGLILLAQDHSVQKINELWNTEQVHKEYFLLTDQKIDLQRLLTKYPGAFSTKKSLSSESLHFHIKTDIQKKGKEFQSSFNSTPNSETEFLFEKQIGDYYLWRAILHSGKTHQIRLHCQNLGMPILGDEVYGGQSFYRICLHSFKIKIQGQEFQTELPLWANDKAIEFLKSERLLQKIQDALFFRQQMYTFEKDDVLRWLHQEVPGIKLDQYGEYLYLYDYQGYTKTDLQIPELISKTINLPLFVRQMQDRGDDPNQNYLFKYNVMGKKLIEAKESCSWQAKENGASFELRTHQGLSPGLFLDQRENRAWVLGNSSGKSILNLFSYTSGFSVLAALGKAKEIDTVDVSPNFIDWSKKNFEINQIELKESYRFWVQDCLFFLKMSLKKEKKWDLIICDPPTFGRSKNGVFQIEKNFEELIQNIFTCTHDSGHILLSLNFEKWSYLDFVTRVRKALNGKKFSLLKTPFQSLDFDFPHQESLMKSLIISKQR